jgi:hypothetical protein
MLHLGQAGVQDGPQQGFGVLGSQFQPCSQPGSVGVRRFLDELDAQVSAARKADQQHGFSHARLETEATGPQPSTVLSRGQSNGVMPFSRLRRSHAWEATLFDRPRSKTPDQLLPAMWAGEDVGVVTQRGHNLGLRGWVSGQSLARIPDLSCFGLT